MPGFGNPLLDFWRTALEHQRDHLGRDLVRPLFECTACVAAWRPGAPLSDLANARVVAMSRYGCGILDDAAVSAIRAWAGGGGIVEVGAGTGYNARVLRDAGLDVVATDVLLAGETPEAAAWQATAQPSYVLIERMDAEVAVRRYPGRTLLMVWPAYDDSYAARALAAYTGDVVIYLGEYRGATADGAFHDALDRDWECIVDQHIPGWASVDDRLYVYRRTP